MRIIDHRLNEAPYHPTRKQGGKITPRLIVMHYTAGWSASGAIHTLADSSRQASAHVVVSRNGDIDQIVDFNKKAWHAGPSRYEGYRGLNNYSIGIEIVNIGWVKKLRGGNYKDPYGQEFTYEGLMELGDFTRHAHSRVGSGDFAWQEYTQPQLYAVQKLTEALLTEYPTIHDIVSHEEIDTRGWKTDPGPEFPMHRFKSLLSRDDEGAGNYGYTAAEGVPHRVTVDGLNVRSGPGKDNPVIDVLYSDMMVQMQDRDGEWRMVSYHNANTDRETRPRAGSTGWVHQRYIRPA